MGPKISEAKTPPLRKPASLLSSPFYLSFFKHLSFLLKHKKSVFFFLSHMCQLQASSMHFWACSNFKHAHGGRMCPRATCASLRRLSFLSSSAIVLFFFFFLLDFSPPLITLSYLCHLLCSTCISLAYSSFSPVARPLHNCHTYEPHACTSEHMTVRATRNAQTGAHGQ